MRLVSGTTREYYHLPARGARGLGTIWFNSQKRFKSILDIRREKNGRTLKNLTVFYLSQKSLKLIFPNLEALKF